MSFERSEECQDLSFQPSPELKEARLPEPKDELKNKQDSSDWSDSDSEDEPENKQDDSYTPLFELTKISPGEFYWSDSEPEEEQDKLKNKQAVPDFVKFFSGPLPAHSSRPTYSSRPTHSSRCKECVFCGGAHREYYCDLNDYCPHDQEFIGEDCVVVCVCGTKVIDGKCPAENCGNTWGRALWEKSERSMWSDLFQQGNE